MQCVRHDDQQLWPPVHDDSADRQQAIIQAHLQVQAQTLSSALHALLIVEQLPGSAAFLCHFQQSLVCCALVGVLDAEHASVILMWCASG
jgi:hypothetical protein